MKTNTRWPSLIVLCIGFLLIVVDMTIVNVALPSIQNDLQFTQAGLAWVVNAYLIAFGGLLLLAGRLGDLFGRKRTFLIGLGIFVGASVLCGLSFNQPMLIAARFVQGIGGAISSAVILAMIVTLFPEPDEQAKAGERGRYQCSHKEPSFQKMEMGTDGVARKILRTQLSFLLPPKYAPFSSSRSQTTREGAGSRLTPGRELVSGSTDPRSWPTTREAPSTSSTSSHSAGPNWRGSPPVETTT